VPLDRPHGALRLPQPEPQLRLGLEGPSELEARPPLAGQRGAARRALLAGGPLWYSLVRARRRTLSIVVDRARVEVRAPRWTPIGEIEAFLADKESWIRRRIELARRDTPVFSWREGERLPLWGESVALSVRGDAGVWRRGPCLEIAPLLAASSACMRAAVLEWLRAEARHVFIERVAHFLPRVGVAPTPDIRLSSARTQWGSCNARGRILLNWRLVHLPMHLVDYVVAHELSHLRELNHSPRFWAVVSSLYPAHEVARRELETVGRRLPDL
jgi:predicted metal-dependent hydrolase